jgi:multiple sugar transport system substrate-binding protein
MLQSKLKVLSYLLIICVVSASFAACTPEPTAAPTKAPAAAQPQAAPTTAPPAAVQPITLEFWFHEFAPEVEMVNALAKEYTAAHPNVKINITAAPLVNYTQKLAVAMSTGTGPDIYDLGTWFMPTYQTKGQMAPVDYAAFGWKNLEDAKNAYLPGTLDGLIYKDQLVGIPIQMNSFSLFINNQNFKDAGLDPVKDAPKTWDELITVAKKVQTMKDGKVDVAGFDFSYNGANWHMFMFEPILHQYGGEILDKDGKVVVNNEAGVKAMTLIKKIVVDEGVGDPVRANAAAGKDRYLETGKRAMYEQGPFQPMSFLADDHITKGGYTVVPLPQLPGGKTSTLLYGFAWTVNPAIPDAKKKAAWDFVAFSAKNPTAWLTKCGFFIPQKGWTDTAEAKKIPFLDVFTLDASRGKYLVNSIYYNEISQAITRAMDKVTLEKADPKAALDIAAQEITAAMK